MLLDSCVIIDLLRGRTTAIEYVANLAEAPAVSVITVTEILAGCRVKTEYKNIQRLLEVYVIMDVNRDIAELAGSYVKKYGPSHNVDPMDALIAATASSHKAEFATLNLKHFPMLDNLARPY